MDLINLALGFFKGGSSLIGLKIKIVAILTAVTFIFGMGYKVAMWRNGAAATDALINQRAVDAKRVEDFNARMKKNVDKNLALSAKYRDLYKRLNDVEIPDCTISDDALRVWNDAGSY